jgi:trans-aconitate 2-methyltransferase
VELIVSDLLELELPEPVDAVFSNATFHWIADHERLFSVLAGLLKPGGRLVAQCGGAGNVATLRAAVSQEVREPPFAEHFADWETAWNFATVPESRARLEEAGFVGVDCWDERRTVKPRQPRDYLATVCLGAHLGRLPPELHERFVSGVAAHMPDGRAWMSAKADPQSRAAPELGYVRLNLAGSKK